MRVAKAKSDSDKIFNNQGINERNMRIAELADNQTIFYIDVNDVVCLSLIHILLSVDVAHGIHPNQAGKMDLTNKPVLGRGFCIKEASSQSYATDCEAIAIIQQICEKEKIAYQKFVNRSDMPGGSTLGSIASALLPVKTVDIGIQMCIRDRYRGSGKKHGGERYCQCGEMPEKTG